MALTHAVSTNSYGPYKFIVANTVAKGTHTTLASAMADAVSGDKIYLRDSVTEDVTVTPGVDVIGPTSAGWTPTVTITGNLTMTGAGTSTISNVRLQTNSAAFLTVSGSNICRIILSNCFLNSLNNNGISFTNSNASSVISVSNCNGDLGSNTTFFSGSSIGQLQIYNSNITNTGLSNTASTFSAGSLLIKNSIIMFPVTTSGTSSSLLEYVAFECSAVNAGLTIGGSGSNLSNYLTVKSGTASAISVGSTLSLPNANINSSNTNAITGGGTLSLGEVAFSGSSSTINTTTVSNLTVTIGSLGLKTPLTVPNGGTSASTLTGVLTGNGTSAVTANAVTQHGVLIAGASNAVSSLGVAATGTVMTGVTGADPAFSATPTVTSITFGSGTALSNYAEGTFTPTVDGAVSGTTTYTAQDGYYTRIGNLVYVEARITITAATGTGNATFGGLPFTIKNQTNGFPNGTFYINGASWTWPALTTSLSMVGNPNATTATAVACGSGAAGTLQMNNSAASFRYTMMYQV